ncbi:DNA-directed RNA polymerase III, subunit Rpc31 [Lasiosphaeria ovina]|uniref:DNA-directed RNA polymerase III subunit n=1 Tax=Lasiosphaeria ovina TaxID=92902 RepID=A0AAE0MYP9_9PEZI|nr:DNA-directed RNA polymerase III, subunit Rpc31 [Lasiosphaeria ovina]
MDSEIVLDGKPSELFPPYDVPQAPALSKKEEKQVSFFLLFREQCHDGPLYTQARTQNGGRSGRTYGQDQINKRYGQTSKATVDPFFAVPTYSQKFKQVERTLPDLDTRPFAKEFFPSELHATLDGDDSPTSGPANKRRKTGPKVLALSNITSLKTAEELFLPESQQSGLDATVSYDKALQVLNALEKRNEDGDDEGFLSGEDDDDWVKAANEDDEAEANVEDEDQYDDESGDDYNAEAYFEGNQDDEDYDEGGDDGGGGDYM